MDLALPALIIATVSLAISITVLVLTLPRRRPAPKITQQIHLPEPWEQFATAAAARAKREAATYSGPPAPPARPGPTTQMIRRIDQNLPRETGRRAARKDQA